jgi:hypothetical protein
MRFRENTDLSLFDWIWKNTDQLHTWKAGDSIFSDKDQASYICLKDHPIGIHDFSVPARAITNNQQKKFERMEKARLQGKLEEAIVQENFTVYDLMAIHEIVASSFTKSQLQAVCKDLIRVISQEPNDKERDAWQTIFNVAKKRLSDLESKDEK